MSYLVVMVLIGGSFILLYPPILSTPPPVITLRQNYVTLRYVTLSCDVRS